MKSSRRDTQQKSHKMNSVNGELLDDIVQLLGPKLGSKLVKEFKQIEKRQFAGIAQNEYESAVLSLYAATIEISNIKSQR